MRTTLSGAFRGAGRGSWIPAIAAGVLLAGCSGGASSTRTTDDLAVSAINVTPAATWKLNRPIDVTFNKPVDFSTVSLNTIYIGTSSGAPATGSFSLLGDGRTVRFQPTCPTRPDHADAGLKPGGVQYTVHVLGSSSGGVTVRATDGDALEKASSVQFQTPVSTDPLALFLDTVPGPPATRVRGRSGVALDDPNATYLELGGDPDQRVYFVWDPVQQVGLLEAADMLVPINKYSEIESRVAVVVHFNQPVSTSEANLDDSQLLLQYFDVDVNQWRGVGADVGLIENCSETGASVRIEPTGILPQGADLRVNVRQGFADLVGDSTLLDADKFATMETAISFDPGTTNPGDDGDEVLELFNVSGSGPNSLEDVTAAFANPHADWGQGKLQASFAFGGTGGMNGNFDWHVPPGTDFILNTTSSAITGGPGGVPVFTQSVINGIVDVRNLYVPPNSSIVIQGPNTCTILASGTVRIEGLITINGTSSKGVTTLNTTNQPEPGAAGNGGGGRGGTASYLTTQSTPRGGSGFGPFNLVNGGGQGGETCYAPNDLFARRGAGGGGGAFGPDHYYIFTPNPSMPVRCQELLGFDAEPGFGGGPDPGKGAISQTARAQGGSIGPRPFIDSSSKNDFLGTMLTVDGELILGELTRLWAGAGGGAGGDSVNSDTFPLTPFLITGDEKGSGAGGGAGGLQILAIGDITIGTPGSTVKHLSARGGQGGGGENAVSGFNRIGGGSGGGSGGHIVLSTASDVIVYGRSSLSGRWYHDDLNGHKVRAIEALGGQGGAGAANKGGSKFNGEPTPWRCDAIPLAWFLQTGTPNPPREDANCFGTHGQLTDPLGPVLAAGGDGSPGLIQIHVADPTTNILFPDVDTFGAGTGTYGDGLDVTQACAPPPVGWTTPETAADRLIPFFGRLSSSQSRWIPLGLARIGPEGLEDPPEFQFRGTDTASGVVDRIGGQVDLLDPIVGPAPLDAGGTTPPYVAEDAPNTVVVQGAALADDIYLRNPNLVKGFSVVLGTGAPGAGNPPGTYFDIAAGSYDGDTDLLSLTVASGETSLYDLAAGGGFQVSVLPHYFRVVTNNSVDSYPEGTEIRISFEATKSDSDGNPDVTQSTGYVTDITALNSVHYDFVRFLVEFDLNTSGGSVGLNTPRPGIEFIRVPFRF